MPWARYTVDVQEKIEKGLLEPEEDDPYHPLNP